MPCFKSIIFFVEIALKLSYFCKIFVRLGLRPLTPVPPAARGPCPQTPSLWQLGNLPPDPHYPPAAGGSAPRPPKQLPPLRISGNAPVCKGVFECCRVVCIIRERYKSPPLHEKRVNKKKIYSFFISNTDYCHFLIQIFSNRLPAFFSTVISSTDIFQHWHFPANHKGYVA